MLGSGLPLTRGVVLTKVLRSLPMVSLCVKASVLFGLLACFQS